MALVGVMIKKVEKSLHIVQFVEYFVYFCDSFACYAPMCNIGVRKNRQSQ